MPEAFERCVKSGGRVRTIKPRPDVYIRICYPRNGGPPVRGEVKHIEHPAKRLARRLKKNR